MKKAVIAAGFETLYFSGMHRVARQFLAGAGAILTFHRVLPANDAPFQPNRVLEITPEFLEQVIVSVRAAGIEIVSMDEAHRRLTSGADSRRFVVLTFDDGYRDNMQFAWPILKRHAAPFTLYVPSAFAEGTGELWWVALEKAIAREALIEVELDGEERAFDCSTAELKQAAFAAIYAHLRAQRRDADLRRPVREIAFGYGIDMARQCRELCMTWDELAVMAADPLTTIGAHTVTHPILATISAEAARAEMVDGAAAIEKHLGVRPEHVSYPVGGPDCAGPREFALAAGAGFRTGVTTRPGVLFSDHGDHLLALPRLSINGEFQRRRYLDVLLSGAASALANRFRRVSAA
jgi:peptidoglycan/xylan/chitin deacetylase (PgdA/CDA1 family)